MGPQGEFSMFDAQRGAPSGGRGGMGGGGGGLGFAGGPPQQQQQHQPMSFVNYDYNSGASAGMNNLFGPPPPVARSYGGFEDEAPLLEELGINFSQIYRRTKAVLHPLKMEPHLMEDGDLSGPLMFCLLFGACQLLLGKLHFGYILGWGVLGSLLIYALFNLLAGQGSGVDLYRCTSVAGYCLLPMALFSSITALVPFVRGWFSVALAAFMVGWSSRSASLLLVSLVPSSRDQRWLIAYPCALVYTAFALLTLF
eukprot:jgi/Chlat1/935/Chrsp108S01427